MWLHILPYVFNIRKLVKNVNYGSDTHISVVLTPFITFVPDIFANLKHISVHMKGIITGKTARVLYSVHHMPFQKELFIAIKVDIISMKKCIVVTDFVMTLLVPAKVLIHVWS